MNYLNPIYTERRECQDCYKCVRHCPVKAIKIEGGYASVIAELCIYCGQCVEVCPNNAKRVRDDLPQARQLLTSKRRVFVSLAPSFVSEFPDWRPGQIIRALLRLGFAGVSETALGAQQVSAHAAAALATHPGRVLFSSACPTVVTYLQRHRPGDSARLTALMSPLLTHCKLLRQQYGPDIGIVFIGPCIAKKLEAAAHPELLDVVLTFADLRRWWEQEGLAPGSLTEDPGDQFVPERAAEGAWYAVDGGMIAGMKPVCPVNDASFMAFSGIRAIEKAIDDLEDPRPEGSLFLELLACEGGCVNGPRAAKRSGTAGKRCRVLRYGQPPPVALPRPPRLDIRSVVPVATAAPLRFPDSQLREALRMVGKFSRDDELNCGGCGYDSCRAFAEALLNRKAERSMCVTYMRKLALKKANALLQKMPSAVVIVNEALRILEFNAAFARLVGRDPLPPEGGAPLLEGVLLAEVMPFAPLFHSVLQSGQEVLERDLRHQNAILHATIFTIEKHSVVGGILQDITEPAVRKEQVIRKAREVIQRSLATTQEIARLLGENAAASEITLNSIIESFTPAKPEEPRQEKDWRTLYKR
ncbi:MAG TPA: [Fe-Fe] hydrogenase large subunit C-terminal domain-containing protein [Verrucomicrobiota bacterium]|nr:[Fe-Fe] hydrogenase large subunit C-terminal domain-containing protein [Verrucomicrobiota bacterium]HRT07617.1 [Fe-Fe] hydrogenase large subunit C-terminal domain-containing protein [Candidatus Paceibacterota bacterium]HRT56622.1 [Fe-Fe] hydrogenase large subunit C-terminal domain-containing protein [Candidatus Paceibacterota bacterium]